MTIKLFGNPITNETLESMHEYHGKTITRRDRAHVALNRKTFEHKYENTQEYVKQLKDEWGWGVSTLCLIYNATGDKITYADKYDWYGHIGYVPCAPEIENGQWSAFLHGKTTGSVAGSVGAVVYHGQNNDDEHCDWMASWSNPWNHDRKVTNAVYTEILEQRYYHNEDHWDYISHKLYRSGFSHSNEWNGCVSNIATEEGTTIIVGAIFTLANT